MIRRSSSIANGLIILFVLIAATLQAQSPDIQDALRSRYRDKVLVLRGFFPADRLRYDESGGPLGNPATGVWTTDAFLLIDEVNLGTQSFFVKGRRMIVISEGKGFHFLAESPKKRKKAPIVEIEARLGSDVSLNHIELAMARIFLTDHDSIVPLLPFYWQSCVSAGLYRVNDPKFDGCHFSTEMLSIPGMDSSSKMSEVQRSQDEVAQPETLRVFKAADGISPPRQIYAPEPELSEIARQRNLEGVVTLVLIVDDKGNPRNIEIASPFGAGLDEEAVKSVNKWKFKPAERNSHPVATKIAVEIDIHLR